MNGGWGGFGGWGNGFGMTEGILPYFYNTQTQNDVNRGFDNSGLSSQIAAVQASVNDVNTGNQLSGIRSDVNAGFASAEVSNCNRAFNQMQTSYQNQIASLQNSFSLATAVDDRLDNLSMSLQKCCCANELATAQTQNLVNQQAAENRYQNAINTRDILTNATANTQAVLDKLCQIELDTVKSSLEAERRENNNLRTAAQLAAIQASQATQTGQLMADNAAQTAQLIQRIAPYPVPAYQVGNPYGYYYNNGFNGCGCGCGLNAGVA